MPHSASHSTEHSADRLGAVGRVLISALDRGETTLGAIEQQIGAELANGTQASSGLLSTWAAVVYCRAATAAACAAEARTATGGPPSRRGSKKGRPPESGRGEGALAAEAVNRLRLYQWSRRRELVQREHHTFRGSIMARALLVEALTSLPNSPEDSGRWAELAGIAVGIDRRHYCESDAEQAALGLRAEIYQANALRCEGSFAEADGTLRRAIVEAREGDLRDPTLWAEVKWFLASLRRAQRRFREAIQEAHLAAALWAEGGQSAREVLSRWQIATIHEQLGDPQAALAAIRQASERAADLDDEELRFGVRHAEVVGLARAGFFLAAQESCGKLAPDYAVRPAYDLPRFWTEGLIAVGRGRIPQAEQKFRAARDGFLAMRQAYDAALVTLDWSLLLLDQNRADEVLPLAVSMGQAFEALGVARETLASWAIFQTAAERRELSRAVAESLVRTLGEERVGAKPGR